MKTLAELAGEKWYFQPSLDDDNADILRRDKNGRSWIGPLATVPLGEKFEDEADGDEAFFIEGEDGRNLYAVAALPQFAALVTWAREELKRLDETYSDSAKTLTGEAAENRKFREALAERLAWLTKLVDERDPEMYEGDYSLATQS
jgi:hypothetical protein